MIAVNREQAIGYFQGHYFIFFIDFFLLQTPDFQTASFLPLT